MILYMLPDMFVLNANIVYLFNMEVYLVRNTFCGFS